MVTADSKTQSKLVEVKESSEATQRSIEKSLQIQKHSNEVLERKVDQTGEKVSSQLNMLERCQNHYFPTLISFVKSLNNTVKISSDWTKDVQGCLQKYFPPLLYAMRITLVKIDDLATLGAQPVAA